MTSGSLKKKKDKKNPANYCCWDDLQGLAQTSMFNTKDKIFEQIMCVHDLHAHTSGIRYLNYMELEYLHTCKHFDRRVG